MTRRRLSNRRYQQHVRHMRRGSVLLVLAVGLLAALIYFQYSIRQEHIARHDSTLCRVDNQVSRETVLIIDATDRLSTSQGLLIKTEIRRLLNDALVDERFTLYLMGDTDVEASGRFTVCNPGDGRDKSPWLANIRRLHAQWKAAFYDRMVAEVDLLLGERTANQSPVLEMIQYVAAKTLYASDAAQKRLILASDMLQHTADLSHYQLGTTSLKEPYLVQVRPLLDGVDVEILYLWRSNVRARARQHPGHLRFWEDYIRQANGVVTRVQMVN